jgi:mannose-6-phosphate isomerase-like protein (cupin superfamily)
VAGIDNAVLEAVRLLGENAWHTHEDYEETFYLIDGDFAVEFEDRIVKLATGDLFVVQRGLKHRGKSESGALLLRLEKQSGRTTPS